MEEGKARELGYPTDIVVRTYVKTAVEPFPQLLIAPAIAISKALDRAGLKLDDIDLFEIHEAFAAQVLSTLKVLASKEYSKQSKTMEKQFQSLKAHSRSVLHKDEPVGVIPLSKINVNGGYVFVRTSRDQLVYKFIIRSIAIGHPFAATGGRLVASATNELRRSKKRFCLISICAAGGIGGVMILERRFPG